jgi:hypothetical protein
MLGRIHSFLFVSFIVLVGVFSLSSLANAWCGYDHICWTSALPVDSTVKFLVLYSIAVAWGYLRKIKSKKRIELWQSIWLGVVRRYLILRLFRGAFLCYSGVCLALLSFFFAYGGCCQFISAISLCADNAGAYELAEWLYRKSPDRKTGQSMGISKFSSVPESEHERLWRNTAVAKIYGANSAEIARRLFFVGMNIEVSTPGEQGYNDFAFSWFEKSYVVARAHDYNGVALDDLCQMALIKYDTKNPTSCLPYIVQASELISLFPESFIAMSEHSSSLLPYMAAKCGDAELAKTFKKMAPPIAPRKGFLDATSIAILMPLAVVPTLCSRLGLITPFLINLLLIVLYRRSNRSFVRSTDLRTSMAALNRLIDIDLYRGNYPAALRHSESLLQLVGH